MGRLQGGQDAHIVAQDEYCLHRPLTNQCIKVPIEPMQECTEICELIMCQSLNEPSHACMPQLSLMTVFAERLRVRMKGNDMKCIADSVFAQ